MFGTPWLLRHLRSPRAEGKDNLRIDRCNGTLSSSALNPMGAPFSTFVVKAMTLSFWPTLEIRVLDIEATIEYVLTHLGNVMHGRSAL